MNSIVIRCGSGVLALAVVAWMIKHRDHDPADGEIRPLDSARHGRTSPVEPPDFRAMFDQAMGDPDVVRRHARLAALAERWGVENAEAALKFARELPAGEARDTACRQLLVAWAIADAASALSWSDRLESDSERGFARSVICISVAEKTGDPRLAIELALGHGADEGGDGLLENLTMQWAAREPSAALEWIKSQPAGDWRDRLLARAAFILSKSDPHAAACQVVEEIEPGPAQTEAILSVLHQWAAIDPSAAAKWVTSFPPGTLLDQALAELAGRIDSRLPAATTD